MKNSKNNMYWILAFVGIVVAVGWYISNLLMNPIIFLTCLIVSFLVAAYVLTSASKRFNEQNSQKFEDTLRIAAENKEFIVNNIKNVSDTTKGELILALQQAEKSLTTAFEEDSRKTKELLLKNHDSVSTMITEAHKENLTVLGKVQNELTEQEQLLKEDHIALREDMQGIAGSFENAVEAYHEMELRMAALEQQNIHLQHLTTLIGTVRSDIAVINEIRGFAKEAQAGRKVRIVRDDENKIVVESLMNSDGVRIEKSKMYRNNLLVFEAEFNAAGQMITSHSYDKEGKLDTEVTYAVEDHGRPILREVAQNVVTSMKTVATSIGKKKR